MEKVRPWCGQPSDRGRLKNRTEHNMAADTVENAYLAAALASGRGVKNNYIFGIPNPDLPIYYIVRSVAVVQSVHPISCTLSSVSLEYSEYTPLSFTS